MTADLLDATAPAEPGPGLTPLRRGLLLVGVAGSVMVIGFGVLNVVGWMARATSVERYDLASPEQNIEVHASGGSIEVVPSRDDLVHLTTTSHYSLSKPTIQRIVDGHGIRVSADCNGFNLLSCSVDFQLEVPPSYDLQAESGGGRVEATGLTGRVELHTGGGRIEAADLSGPVVLDTGGGNISGTDLRGPTALADTGGGNIDLVFTGDAVTSVHAESGGGNVTVAVPPSLEFQVDADSGGGDVETAIPSFPGADRLVYARSGGGDVTVTPSG